MGIFCPFLKNHCKQSECVMWQNNKCLTISFMQYFLTPKEDYSVETEKEEEAKVPEVIQTSPVEQLAKELVSFVKDNTVDVDSRWIDQQMLDCFWESKGISGKYDLPSEIRLKMDKVQHLAEKQLEEERELREKEQLKKEKAQIPQLIEECIVWARRNNLTKSLKKADVDVFLSDKEIKLSTETKHLLWSMVNVQLKAKT